QGARRRERMPAPGGRGHHLRLEIHRYLSRARGGFDLAGDRANVLDRELHRDDAVAIAVVEEDAAERRRDHGPEAELAQRLGGALARGAAAEIAVGKEDLGAV